jgi:hypothetical protein
VKNHNKEFTVTLSVQPHRGGMKKFVFVEFLGITGETVVSCIAFISLAVIPWAQHIKNTGFA